MNRRQDASLFLTALTCLMAACGPSAGQAPPEISDAGGERAASLPPGRQASDPTDTATVAVPKGKRDKHGDGSAVSGAPAPDWGEEANRSSLSHAAWREIDALQKKKRLDEAVARATRLREQAIDAGNPREWALALMREARLRAALEGPQSALDHLVKAPWPDSLLWQAALNLAKAQTLTELAREIPIDGRGPALPGALQGEIDATFAAVWQHRNALAALSFEHLTEVIERNTFPMDVRPTPRDALSYLWAGILADRALWKPFQRDRAAKLALADLLLPPETLSPADPDAHPLTKLSSVLADLERWHLAQSERAAALEAARVRFEALDQGLASRRQRAGLRAHFEKKFGEFRDVPGFAVAMHALARARLGDPDEGACSDARRLAQAGWDAFPERLGGQLCDALVEEIERPHLSIQALDVASPGKPSLLVTHAGADRLFFRAYAFDARSRFLSQHTRDINFTAQEIALLIAGESPAFSWRVDLESQGDCRPRETLVTAPIDRPGSYLLLAAPNEEFDARQGPLLAATFSISSLLVTLQASGRDLLVQAFDARDGHPVPGAKVELFAIDQRRASPRVPLVVARTNAQGQALLRWSPRKKLVGAIVRRGEDVAHFFDLDETFGRAEQGACPCLRARLFLERDICRPQDRLGWKAIAWQEGPHGKRTLADAGTQIEVELLNAVGERSFHASSRVSTLGTAQGTIDIPGEAVPGTWSVRLTAKSGVHRLLISAPLDIAPRDASPPQVALLEIEGFQRMGRKGSFAIRTRTAEGAPLQAGTGRWRLFREGAPSSASTSATGAELIDAGEGRLDVNGHLAFSTTPTADEGDAAQGNGARHRYRLEVEVLDDTGAAATVAQAFTLAQPDIELALVDPPGFLIEGEPAELTLVRRRPSHAPSPGPSRFWLTKLDLPEPPISPSSTTPAQAAGRGAPRHSAAFSDEQRAHFELSSDAFTSPDVLLASMPDGEKVSSGALTHGAEGLAAIALPALQAGAYRLHCETRDAFGEKRQLAHALFVASKAPSLPLPALFLAEQSSVPVGGRLRLFAHSGRAQQKMLLEIFRNGQRISRRWLTAQDSAALIELPIRAADRGGLRARLTLAIDGRLRVLEQAIDVPQSDRRLAIDVHPLETATDAKPPQGRALHLSLGQADGRHVRSHQVDLALAISARPPVAVGDDLTRTSRKQANAIAINQRTVAFAALSDRAPPTRRQPHMPFVEDRFRSLLRRDRSTAPADADHSAPGRMPPKVQIWRPALRLDGDGSAHPRTFRRSQRGADEALGTGHRARSHRHCPRRPARRAVARTRRAADGVRPLCAQHRRRACSANELPAAPPTIPSASAVPAASTAMTKPRVPQRGPGPWALASDRAERQLS